MALVADTQHAVEMLCGMQTELQQTGDEELGQQLSDMINMLESPLFTQLLTLQQSMRQLRDHVESTPPGQPIGEFDFNSSGDLVFEEPPKPEPVELEQPGPAHPYAYENEINLEDEIGRVQVAAVEQSAPAPVVEADELDTGDALLDSIAELAMGREVTTVKLMKPEKGGLGFSVVGLKSENHGELGIFVQQIQPNGVAERNGDLHESDQILAINGHLLDASVSHQQAIEMLQKVKGLVELVVARGVFQLPENALKETDPPKEEEQPTSPEKPEDIPIEPPQHEIQQIELYNDGSGLGFGIVGVRDVGIMVKTILPGGTADRDGRLQSGDIILQIGDTPLQGMTSDQVAMVLRQAGSHVRLTVARSAFPAVASPLKDAEPLIQPEPVIQPQHTTEDYSQPPPQLALEGESESVKIFDVVLEKEAKGLGITIAGYVRDVATGQVSGIFIKKIAEGSAADRNGNVKVNDQIIEVDGQSLDGFTNVEAVDMLRNTGSVVHVKLARHPEGTLDISNVNMEQLSEEMVRSEHIQPTQVETEEEAQPLAPAAYPPPGGILEPVEPDPEPQEMMETYEGELSTETEVRLISAWQTILGEDIMIVVAQLSKFREGGGLGISLEGTVDIDESGDEVRPHHYIRSILADGPVGQNAQLKSGDELLEVNGEQLLGLNHVDVVKTLKELPMHVRIVCARHPHPVFPEAAEVPQPKIEEVAVTVDAQEEVFTMNQTNLQESLPFPEVENVGSVLAVQTLRDNSSDRASPLSRESLGGLAVWDDELQTVDLNKGDKGLGFSILDYQDPLNPSKTVIVIRSLVPGGVAESDGRLIPGDRLAFVNDDNLDNCSLEMAVQALKGAPTGPVLLRVAKPLPQPLDGQLEGEEPMIMPQQIASVHQAPPPSNSHEISFQDEDLEKIRELQASLHTSQKTPSWDTRPNEEDRLVESLVEEVIMSASVSSNVESSMDLSQVLDDKPEPASVPPPASTAPPDLVLASTPSHIKPQDTDKVNAAPVPAVQSTPPEPRRHPPPPPPKPSPRTSVAVAAAVTAASTVDDSQMSEKDPRVAAVATSHSPLSKRVSIILPNYLEKSIVLKKGNAGLGLTVNADKSNGVMVKSIIRGGAVHHDGRLAVGDLITSVNHESMRGLTNAEARALLRRASLIGSDISITYIPACDASAYRENPSTNPLGVTDPNASQSEGNAVAAPTVQLSSLPAEDGSESEKFALPLRDQPVDSVKLASVALSPVSVTSGSEWEAIRTVRLNKEPNKSLGISIVGGRAGDGQPVQGIYIKHVLDDSQAGRTHALKTGDRILEVNGCDLRDASHDYAVAIIRNAANPVCFIVQSLSAGANMPTGVVSIITNEDEDQVVAVAAESSETIPAASDAKEEAKAESEEAAGKEDYKAEDEIAARKEDYNDEETISDRLKVDDLELAPLSPLKHQLSLSGSEDEDDEKKDADSLPDAENNRAYGSLDGEIFVVNLTKSSKGLGISLAGNRDRSKMSVFVVGVDPAGAAAQDGRLHVADEILKINNLSVFGKSHQKASAIIKEIPRDGEVVLIVRRHPLAMDQLAVIPLTPTATDKQRTFDLLRLDPTPAKPESDQNEILASYPNVHTVTIKKGTGGLGFAIFEKQDSLGKCGIFIRDVIPGGAADVEGRLQGGDHILSVDDNTLIDTKKKDAIVVLKATAGKVSLTVSSERPLVHLEDVDTESIERDDEEYEMIEEEEMIVAAEVTTEEHALPSLMEELMNAGVMKIEDEEEKDDGMVEDEREQGGVENGEQEEDEVKQEEEMERRVEDEDQVVQASVVQIQHQEPIKDVVSHDIEEPAPHVAPKLDTTTPDVAPEAYTPTEPEGDTHTPDVEPKTDTPTPNMEPEAVAPTPDPYTRPILPGVPTDIIVDKGKTGLGLSIVGGVDTQLNIVVVHEVYEERAAARDGRLWPGDQLVQVNGIDLTNARHEDAISALRQSPAHVRLTVYRDQQATKDGAVVVKEHVGEEEEPRQDEEKVQDEDEYDKMLSVELKHTPGRSLGVNIMGNRSGQGVVVSMILRGGAAHAEGTLMAGDHILSINGKDVQNATREEVASLLKATEGHVLFEIGRKKDSSRASQPAEQSTKTQVQPAGTAGKPVRNVELKKVPGKSLGLSIAGGKGSEMGDIPLIIASITPGSQADEVKHLKVLDCIEGINGQSVAGLSYANAIHLLKSSQGVIKLAVSELNPTMKEWYLKSQQASGKGDSMVAVKASVQKPVAAVAEDASAGRVKTIELQRGPDGLGFSIVGGFGSPHGDLPIYIKTVFTKGAATVSGELKRGDQIIAVNGESLDGATHEQAVDVLKRAKGEVIMTVLA
ncbi:multiple PDZ domain protein-like isoform X3 [Asterias rubens]|uniref:multiple PDZ domain protein-like isoform X3 n=1 Tax=Asterias rubens TaxID=7604 RepID=UPI001454E808|nr:multiple PDZ domain protein-like isoform X3 [Asterias rubens]